MTIMKRDYLIIYVVTKILTKEICFGFLQPSFSWNVIICELSTICANIWQLWNVTINAEILFHWSHLSSELDKKLQKLGVRIPSKMRKRINFGLSNKKFTFSYKNIKILFLGQYCFIFSHLSMIHSCSKITKKSTILRNSHPSFVGYKLFNRTYLL